jgi:hypothetical protein
MAFHSLYSILIRSLGRVFKIVRGLDRFSFAPHIVVIISVA